MEAAIDESWGEARRKDTQWPAIVTRDKLSGVQAGEAGDLIEIGAIEANRNVVLYTRRCIDGLPDPQHQFTTEAGKISAVREAQKNRYQPRGDLGDTLRAIGLELACERDGGAVGVVRQLSGEADQQRAIAERQQSWDRQVDAFSWR